MQVKTSVKRGADQFPYLAARARHGGGLALVAAGETLEHEAKQRAPVVTGQLRDSILADQESETRVTVTVGADYGAAVNYGNHNRPANPFWSGAVDYVESIFGQMIADGVRRGLERR